VIRSVRLISAFALVASIWPMPAAADVLEVGMGQAQWIAGGPPASASLAADSAMTAQADGGEIPPPINTSDAAYTPVDDAAGPAQYRARVAELAAKYDLSPALLEALVWQESRWRANAVSHAGARGLAQLMPGTARVLKVNPNDPNQNLEGGARYLRQQLDDFDGNLEKALAAYNAGPLRVTKYGGIPPFRETRDYVAAILARLSAPVRR